jgi:hypothetical protein
MLFQPKVVSHLERLERQLERAQAITPHLMKAMITETEVSTRVDPVVVRRLEQLVAARAWTDAALMLIDVAVPAWKLRRIACDAGAWHCSLSRHLRLPDWLDQTADGRHDALPLAILCALVEARRIGSDSPRLTLVPPSGTITERGVCCDNFS